MSIDDYIKFLLACLRELNKMQNHRFYAVLVLIFMVAALFALPDILAVWR